MLRPRLRKARDASLFEHPRHLFENVLRVGDVMKRIEAADAVNAFVRKLYPVAVEMQKSGRRLVAEDGLAAVKLLAALERCPGYVKRYYLVAQLRHEP